MRSYTRPLHTDCVLHNLYRKNLSDMYPRLRWKCFHYVRRHAVTYIQKRILLKSDIYKSRLHAGQNILYPAAVYVAYQM